MIGRPQKVYVDTNHLVNLVRLRHAVSLGTAEKYRSAYETLDKAISGGALGLIFNLCGPLEWVDDRATVESAREIAAVVESSPLVYLLEEDRFVFLHELLGEIARLDPTLKLPHLPLLPVLSRSGPVQTAHDVLGRTVPGFVPGYDSTTAGTTHDYAEQAMSFRQRQPDEYAERVKGYRDALTHDFRAELHKSSPRVLFIDWCKRFLKLDLILSHLCPGCDVDKLLKCIDVRRCPGTLLFIKGRTYLVNEKKAPEDNDVDDWVFVPIVPYADIVLTERRMRHILVQIDRTLASKVFSSPDEAVGRLR